MANCWPMLRVVGAYVGIVCGVPTPTMSGVISLTPYRNIKLAYIRFLSGSAIVELKANVLLCCTWPPAGERSPKVSANDYDDDEQWWQNGDEHRL